MDCNNHRSYSEVTLAANSHQHVTDKTLKVLNSIGYPTKYLNHNSRNSLVFNGNDPWLVNNNIQNIMKNYNISRYERDSFLNISAYQPSHISENSLPSLKSTSLPLSIYPPNYKSEQNLYQPWVEVTEYLRNLQYKYIYCYKTLFKHSIHNLFLTIYWMDQIGLS